MSDRRLVLAGIACVLLIGGITLTPLASVQQDDEPLESTSVQPITDAIELGASTALAGYLPSSEGYQRARAVIDGFEAGVSGVASDPTSAQLTDVTAIARGAALGALSITPNSPTSSFDRSAMRALATGYMRGALSGLDAAPGAGRTAVDEAAAKGVFAGVVGVLLGSEPASSLSDYEVYGQTLAAGAFAELEADAVLFSTVAGSPALADITVFASDIVRAQLSSLPLGVTRQQLDAIATFGGGSIDGMIEGLVTSFPQGLPAPSRTDLHRWYDAVAHGHEGTAPWSRPASLPALLAWADGVSAAGVHGVAEGYASLEGAAPSGAGDEIAAWATGLAQGGYERLDAIADMSPALQQDVEAYAEALAAPAVEHILSRDHPSADPDAVEAWAYGLTGALDEFATGAAGSARYVSVYLGALANATTSIPPDVAPGQTQLILAFAQGATHALTQRMGNITAIVGANEDPALLQAMATGLAEGAIALANGPSLTDVKLADALGDGLASGFLETKDPDALFDDVGSLLLASEGWFAAAPPVSIATLYFTATNAARDPYAAVTEYGKVMGGAPVDWAANKGAGLTPEAWGAKDDIVWIVAFANETAKILIASLIDEQGGVNRTEIEEAMRALSTYAANVTGSITAFDLAEVRKDLKPAQIRTHATRFADYALAPTEWLGAPDVGGERAAAQEVLLSTLANARTITKFKDAAYAQASIAFVKAMGDGLKEGGKLARQTAGESRPEGGFTPSWVRGVADAIRDVPVEAVKDDTGGRAQWIRTATTVVPGIRRDVTGSQVEAAREFAYASAGWALSAREHVPEVGTLETPLLTWADASIADALASLPPVLTDDERDGVVAYLAGVQEAVESMPPLDVQYWSLPDLAAMDAYVAGITSATDIIKNDTDEFLCAMTLARTGKTAPTCPADETPPSDENGGEDGGGEDGGEDECDTECSLSNWTANLQSWASGLASGGLVQVNRTEPTQAGVALVGRWAFEVLAGHGICPEFGEERIECDGPLGPAARFGQARQDDIRSYAAAVSAGYGPLVEIPEDPTGLTRPVTDPILGWAAGLRSAMGTQWLAPERFMPGEPGEPSTPVTTPADASEDALRAWSESLWDALPQAYDNVWVPFPDTAPLDEVVLNTDYLFAHAIWEGGGSAIVQSARGATQAGRTLTPDTGALDAFALGLVDGASQGVVDPAKTDVELLANWYLGLAQGGVGAIAEAGATIQDEQVPAITSYATFLVGALTPPLPVTPPTPEEIHDIIVPPPDEGGGDTGGNETEPPPPPPPGTPPEERYLTNLQAHGAGLAGAILATPTGPLAANATAFRDAYLGYVNAIAGAASALPPVSPDAGFPARLRAWTAAETEGALGATSADRIGPDPDTAFTLAYVQAFASASPWNLPAGVDSRSEWAGSAILAGAQTACPSGLSADECAALGAALGEVMGVHLPAELATAPSVPGESVAGLHGVLEAIIPVLALPETPAGDALVAGIIGGILPEGAGNASAGEAARATADAIAPQLDELSLPAVHPLAETLAAKLLALDPARYQSLADGAVALALALDPQDPDAVREQVAGYLAASGKNDAAISLADGVRTFGADALDGTLVLDAQRQLTVSVYPSASNPLGSQWGLRWSSGTSLANAKTIPMTGHDGAFSAAIPVEAGGPIRFTVVEKQPTGDKTHDRNGSPFGFVADADAPTATLEAPIVGRASIAVAWSGADRDSLVASYRVEVREADGDWREWIASTTDNGAAFSGAPGFSYGFRVSARDGVGHLGVPSAEARATVPPDAPPNRAPTLAFRAPAAGAIFGKSVPVTLDAVDPDATIPVVRVCIQKADGSVDIACLHEGRPADIVLDVSKIADGAYKLHASASDGTLTAEATSPTFKLDRAPPSFVGAAADASPTRVLLTAALDADAASVKAEAASRQLELRDDGSGVDSRAQDGIWSAETTLAPGEHMVIFRATDTNGNEATMTRTVVVPAPAPPPGTKPQTQPPEPARPTRDATVEPEGENDTPGPAFVVILVALAAVALGSRRRGRT